MRKKLIYVVLVFQVALIVSLVRNIQLSLSSRGRVGNLKEQKDKLEQERGKLQAQLEYVKSDYYLEKVAREELQLTKPGETVVIVPEGIGATRAESNITTEGEDKTQNWQKWWEVIAGKN
ncbi:MAG: septum formation initiator family protein [bacterium]